MFFPCVVIISFFFSKKYLIARNMRCAVATCNMDNQSKNCLENLMFFRFPKDSDRCKLWLNACKRSDKVNVLNARVCSLHFGKEDYARNLKAELLNLPLSKRQRLLKPTAVPTHNLPIPTKTSKSESKRTNRTVKKQTAELIKTVLAASIVSDDGALVSTCLSPDETCSNVSLRTEENDEILTRRDFGTNTENNNEEAAIAKLKEEILKLKTENQIFKTIFTDNELRKLQNPKTQIKWTMEDISKAIMIYSAGARAYRILLKRGYPLPAISTLEKWYKKLKLEPGILKQVMTIAKYTDLTHSHRLCILFFDEMKVESLYLYNKSKDETMKPYSYVQVAMLRGLFGNWKQPVYYEYDCAMTKGKLVQIINFVEKSGFSVVGMVCNFGGENRSLCTELGITTRQSWFLNPANNSKIYVFSNVPHLIKLLRNHFVDQGFHLNGVTIDKSIVEELIELTTGTDLNIAHEVTMKTLHVKGAQRQKIEHATKLFSHTISQAISRCGLLGKFNSESWSSCAEFFKDVTDWFDCMNVAMSIEKDEKKAHGMSLELQNAILDKMTTTMLNLRIQGRKDLLPFQKWIIMTNMSLKLLFEDLKTQSNIKFIPTNRLNQDVLGNFFEPIRAKSLYNHPSPLEFQYCLRAYVLGKNDDCFSKYCNPEQDYTSDLEPTEQLLSKQFFSQFLSTTEDVTNCDPLLAEIVDLQYDDLENLAGFICYKLKNEESSITSKTKTNFSWDDKVPKEGSEKPSQDLMTKIAQLEDIFNEVNSDSILVCSNYIQLLLSKASHILCSDKVKALFFRSRMYFRIRKLNNDLQENSSSKKRKLEKTTC